MQHPELVAQALEAPTAAPGGPRSYAAGRAPYAQVRAGVARQHQRLLEAYLAEVIDLACFQRQDRGLAGQEADLWVREREVAARASGWSR